MNAMTQLRSFAVRLFIVSPFFIFAALVWVSLLSDINSTDNFGLHYKILLAAYPILKIVNGVILYSFSILLIALFVSILIAFNSLFQKRIRAKWLKAALRPLFILIAIFFTASLLIYTPPDGYLVLIFFAVLAAFFTQLHRFSLEIHELTDLRFIFLPISLASLAMTLIFFLAAAWLVVFWTDSSKLDQPWLSVPTLIFMLVSALVMGITTGLTALELKRSFPVWRQKSE
jgi:hypothetical protein